MARPKKNISETDNDNVVKGKKSVIEIKKREKKIVEDKKIEINDDIKNNDNKEEALQVVDVLEPSQDKVVIKKNKNRNTTYLVFKAFLERLKEDKLYFVSLIITIVFFSLFSINKLATTDGYYDKKTENSEVNANSNNDTTKKEDETTVKSDAVDVTGYVGIYSREVVLTTGVKVNDTCSIDDYKLVYEIKSNKKIAKYLMNDCLGTIKIWEGTLTYVSSGGARYISANNINFLFSASSMKEVDADTYKIDEDITSIKENRLLKNTDISFYNNNFIINTPDDLILIKGSNIGYQLKANYNTSSDSTNKTVFKTNTNGTYKFIGFSDSANTKCLNDNELADIEEKELYKVYSIKYNEDKEAFNKAKELFTRKNTDGCRGLEEDIATLNE